MSLNDRKITAWTNPIAAEADRPNRSASAMKAVFDSNSNQLKDAVNGICDDCEIAAEVVRLDPSEENANMKCLHLDGTYKIPSVGRAYDNGVPEGGAEGQFLKKSGAADYVSAWETLSIGARRTVTLTAAGWGGGSQTVSVAGMTEDAVILVGAEEASFEEYSANAVRCSAQGSGTLTFVAAAAPASDLTVNVLILGYC